MRRRFAWGVVALGVWLLAALWFGRENTSPPLVSGVDPDARNVATERAGLVSIAPALAPAVSAASKSSRPASDAAARESEDAARAEIDALVVSYDASALPRLAAYLVHPLAEVRVLAREGIVQLGAVEGAPLLRAAADKAKDPREAVAVLDAADFLDLPPAETALTAKPAPAR